MKAIFPAIPCVDSQPNELEGALTKGDAKEAVSGFDALLALASAHTTEQSRAVKPLAPATTLQSVSAELSSSALLAQEFRIAVVAEHQPPAAEAVQWPQPSTVDAVQCTETEPPTTLESQVALLQTPARSLTTLRCDEPVPQEIIKADQTPEREASKDAPPPETAAPRAELPLVAPQIASGEFAAPPSYPELVQPSERATSRAAPSQSPIDAAAQDAAAQDAATVQITRAPRPRAEVSHSTAHKQAGPSATNGPRKTERSRSTLSLEAEPASPLAPPLQAPVLDGAAAVASKAAMQSASAPVAAPSTTLRQPAQGVLTVAAAKSTPQHAQLAAAPADALGLDQPQTDAVGAQPFAGLLQQPQHEGSQVPADVPRITAAGAAPAAANAPQREVQPLHAVSDPDTGARVVHIEYFTAAAPAARPSQNVAGQDPRDPPATGQLDATPMAEPQDLSADASAAPDASPRLEQEPSSPTGEERPAEDEQPSPQADSDHGSADARDGASNGQEASSQDHSQPRGQTFHATEVQGMRGLDAVVASLLRAGKPDQAVRGASLPERAAFAAPTGPAHTEKSPTSKIAEKAAALVDGRRKDAMEREAERVLERDPVRLDPLPLHIQFEPVVQDGRSADFKVAEAALPTPASPPADPDLANMGKLARGEGVSGASIAIEHPELGPMKVLVQSENGRIDVRAVLETPRAAAVLRAHESALRYGIQQAGMTFGALRVRTRGGEPEPVKTQGTTKRRHRQEWEA